jgi:hypothetical protein
LKFTNQQLAKLAQDENETISQLALQLMVVRRERDRIRDERPPLTHSVSNSSVDVRGITVMCDIIEKGQEKAKETEVSLAVQHHCPDCNSRMTLRNGKNGKFWGCVQYPRCTGVRNEDGSVGRNWRDDPDMGYSIDDVLGFYYH